MDRLSTLSSRVDELAGRANLPEQAMERLAKQITLIADKIDQAPAMKQNLEESYKWFALVAKTGDKDAAAKRDEIANALRPEQLERARAATELWKAKPLNAATNSADIPESWQEGTPQTTAGIDMGEKTKNAIIAFQTDNKLPATGAVDEKLVRALLARK